ncbi:MAG: Gfo/Idh/MocA family oxidoreductase [Alphaproteobacteria bacterium]|nr:Gfo/Idh/MocA family oxidoreductase [Alphaproteobacteria bacterium]
MRLLILGTGGMARGHAGHFAAIRGVKVVACVDTRPEVVTAFAGTYNIQKTFTSLEDALDWGRFDAVANVTPDAVHHETTMKCLAAGKHVFCEKPLATDYAHAREMADAAEAKGLVNMVNLSYRNVAQLHKARALVESGKLGTIRHIEASYLQSWLTQPLWGHWDKDPQWLWRLSTAHGSNGVLGDIGIHILDFAVFAAGMAPTEVFCRLHTFPKAPGDRIGEYVLDANDSFVMSLGFENGAIGVMHASRWASGHFNDLKLRLYGEKGGLELTHRLDGTELRVCLDRNLEKAAWTEIAAKPVETNYQSFARAVKSGVTREPGFRHAAELQRVLDLAIAADRHNAAQSV